jgi:uncharacterized alpha-E superfamily protein
MNNKWILQIWNNLLRVTQNLIYFRKKFKNYIDPYSICSLLILDEKNPHSIAFQIENIINMLKSLYEESFNNPVKQKSRLIQSLILQQNLTELLETDKLGYRKNLDNFLINLSKHFADFIQYLLLIILRIHHFNLFHHHQQPKT